MMEQKMSCERFMGQLDAYLDGALTAEEMRQMEAHADECAKCAEELNAGRQLVQMLRGLDDEIVVPLDVQAGWRRAVRKEISAKKRKNWYRVLGTVAAALVVMIGSTFAMRGTDMVAFSNELSPNETSGNTYVAAGAPVGRRIAAKQGDRAKVMLVSAADAGAPVVFGTDGEEQQKKVSDVVLEDEGAMGSRQTATASDANPAEPLVMSSMPATPEEAPKPTAPLLVYGANREAETENFDQERETLKALVSEYDGYFASDLLTQSDGARCLTSEIRVPAERLDEFVTALDDVGTTLSLESTANDVAAYYYDADARLGTQQAIVARLNQLIPEAQGDELQALNDQLEEAYAAIDELQKLLNRYDSDISYATVRMTLWEKSQFAPEPTKEPTLGERSRSGFQQSLHAVGKFFRDMVVSLAVIAPVAGILIVVGIVVGVIIYTIRKKKK